MHIFGCLKRCLFVDFYCPLADCAPDDVVVCTVDPCLTESCPEIPIATCW